MPTNNKTPRITISPVNKLHVIKYLEFATGQAYKLNHRVLEIHEARDHGRKKEDES